MCPTKAPLKEGKVDLLGQIAQSFLIQWCWVKWHAAEPGPFLFKWPQSRVSDRLRLAEPHVLDWITNLRPMIRMLKWISRWFTSSWLEHQAVCHLTLANAQSSVQYPTMYGVLRRVYSWKGGNPQGSSWFTVIPFVKTISQEYIEGNSTNLVQLAITICDYYLSNKPSQWKKENVSNYTNIKISYKFI